MSNSRDHGRNDQVAPNAQLEDLTELFSMAEDPQFLQACELGRIEFALAVHEDLAARQREEPRESAVTAAEPIIAINVGTRRIPESDASDMDRLSERGPTAKYGQAGGFQRVPGASASVGIPKRVTGSQRGKLALELRRKYEKGASIRALAEQTGRSYGFVHRVLGETGVTLRGRGGATRTKKT